MNRFFPFNRQRRVAPIELPDSHIGTPHVPEYPEEIPQIRYPLPVSRLTTEQEMEQPNFIAQTINNDELRRLGFEVVTLDIPRRRQKKSTDYYTLRPRTTPLTEYRNDNRETNPIIEQLYNYMLTKNDSFKQLLEFFNIQITNFNDNELSNIVTLYIPTITTNNRYLTTREISVFISLLYLYIYINIPLSDPKIRFKLFFIFYNICSLFKIHKDVIERLINEMNLTHLDNIRRYFFRTIIALLLYTPINILLSFNIENRDTPDDIHLILNEFGLLNVLERFTVNNHRFTLDFLSISIESPQFNLQQGGHINKKIKKLKKYK